MDCRDKNVSCFFRKGRLCTFREWEGASLDVLATKDSPGNANCYSSLVGTLQLPCLELDEKESKRGIANLFTPN